MQGPSGKSAMSGSEQGETAPQQQAWQQQLATQTEHLERQNHIDYILEELLQARLFQLEESERQRRQLKNLAETQAQFQLQLNTYPSGLQNNQHANNTQKQSQFVAPSHSPLRSPLRSSPLRSPWSPLRSLLPIPQKDFSPNNPNDTHNPSSPNIPSWPEPMFPVIDAM